MIVGWALKVLGIARDVWQWVRMIGKSPWFKAGMKLIPYAKPFVAELWNIEKPGEEKMEEVVTRMRALLAQNIDGITDEVISLIKIDLDGDGVADQIPSTIIRWAVETVVKEQLEKDAELKLKAA